MIFLEKITIENLKSFKKQSVEFKKNTNVLVGPNGAGKSTIVDGIFYALFAQFLSASKNLNRFINTTAKKKTFTVELDCIINETEYKIKRTWKKNNPEAEIISIVENTKVEGQNAVTDEVIRLLQIEDEKIFRNVIFNQQ